MRRLLLALVAGLWPAAAPAAVIVVSNFTPADLTITVAEPNHKPQTVTLAPAQVAPVTVDGPADVTYPARPAPDTFRAEPFQAYVFLPDDKAGRRVEGIELPGDPPERDARPELNPPPREPVKIPVTLLVDDADPRADALWQKTLRARFDEAAAVIAAHAGVKLEFAGFATWKSDPTVRDVPSLLTDFEDKVRPKPGALAVGYTSRKVEEDKENPAPFGACKPLPARHVLLREWTPRAEAEKVEVLVHHLGLALGATLAPEADGGSVMRPKVADGLVLNPRYRIRFDPLNALAMNLWADEFRRSPVGNLADVSAANKLRLARVYKAMLKARPGDTRSIDYLTEFDREVAKAPEPKKEPGGANPAEPAPAAKKDATPGRGPREKVARAVVKAVTAQARAGTATGDDLMAAYVKAAARAALDTGKTSADEQERVGGFLIGLAVALDDTDAFRNDPLTEAVARAVESAEEREERLLVLGNPTIRGRRDLCRRFAAGCGTGEELSPNRADDAAVARTFAAVDPARPTGVSFPALAAELAGVAFAQASHQDPNALRRLAEGVTAADFTPPAEELRDALTPERFRADYGGVADARFQAVLADLRARAKKHPSRAP